jgi:hypothetical protein
MVLSVHREVIPVRCLGEALGQGPGGHDAVVLQPEIPVEAARVVFLNDEAGRTFGP